MYQTVLTKTKMNFFITWGFNLSASYKNVENLGYHYARETGLFYRPFSQAKTQFVASRMCSASGARPVMPKTLNDMAVMNRMAGVQEMNTWVNIARSK